MHEAPRSVLAATIHSRHVGEQHRMEIAGDLDVVRSRARTFAKLGKFEPGDAVGLRLHRDGAIEKLQGRGLAERVSGQAIEMRRQRLLAFGAERRQVSRPHG